LSVLSALRERVPHADVVYFGDLNNAPYGNKSREELGALTVLGIEKLIAEGATEIVSACNSVSVSIVLPMFEILDIPRTNIIEMVGPTVASFRDKDARVLICATQATVDSRVYQDGFAMLGVPAVAVAIPELVGLIETGADQQALRSCISSALAQYTGAEYTHIVLGCTHYPLVRRQFLESVRDAHITGELVDPACVVADAACERFDTQGTGATRFILSQQTDVFSAYAQRTLGVHTLDVTLV